MTRRHLAFTCEGDRLVGTLDEASGSSGLLFVTGGNETRSGAFSGQAHLAARIAAAGHPVFRFDRRGVGDSEGENLGFRESAPDIAAALAAFRSAHPSLARIVGFGNCDAASALMLTGGAGCDALVLANPWTFESDGETAMSPAAIRSRYAEKLRNPREVMRLVRGNVSPGKLFRGLKQAMRPAPAPSTLLEAMRAGIASFLGDVHFLVAGRDRTGLAFAESWDGDVETLVDADHAFSSPDASDWLYKRLLAALEK